MKKAIFTFAYILIHHLGFAQSKPNLKFLNPDNLSKSPAYSYIAEIRGGRIILISGQFSNDSHGNVFGKGDMRV